MQSFDPIYRKYAPEVFRFAYSLTLDREGAKDITAETFARAVTAYDPSRQPTVRAFLFTIAHRLIMDYFRQGKKHVPLDPDLISHEPHFERQSEQNDLLFQTLRFIQTLPQSEQSAVLMRAQELSYEEISATLNITVAAAKVRVYRARLKLAEWRSKLT